MNNNNKKRRPRKSHFSRKKSSTKNSHLSCSACSTVFMKKEHLNHHLKTNPSCGIKVADAKCTFCTYVGLNENGFKQHLNMSLSCQALYAQMETTTGLLPMIKNVKQGLTTLPGKGLVSTNYNVPRTSGLGIMDTVEIRIQDPSLSKPHLAANYVGIDQYSQYLKQSRTLASLQNNHFSSNFELDETDDVYFEPNECLQMNTVVDSYPLPSELELEFNPDMNDFFDIIDEYDSNEDEDDSLSEEDDGDRLVIGETIDLVTDNNPMHQNLQHQDPPQVVIAPHPDTNILIDIREEQKELSKHFSKLSFHQSDELMIDLFHILKASNAPLILFDRIIEWVKVHEHCFKDTGTLGLFKRKRFIRDLNRQLYRKRIMMKPKVQRVMLSSRRTTSVVTFSMREKILQMVTNPTTFHSGNLLLNPLDPCSAPIDTGYYGEVNTGTWHRDAMAKECTAPNHILMPFCHFIDGLKVDKYGKLTVEAILSCCLWFNRKARNRAANWWVHGFVQDQKLFRDQQDYIRDDRAQDYHDMMAKIFQEMREIRDNGGIRLTLNLDGRSFDVIAIPVIQFIIGDCKGNDLLCGRKGGHSLKMKGLCRDCNIEPQEGDETCLDTELLCSFIKKSDIEGKSKEETEALSYMNLHNAFSKMSIGGCDRGIFGATPAEILHAIQLGMCEYVAESLDVLFTDASLDIISYTVVGIYHNSHRQSERNLPGIGPFRQGLMSIKSLKAKERFARVYCIYLALQNSYCIKSLCKKRLKKRDCHQDGNPPMISRDFLRRYCAVIEDTILFHEWLKQDEFLKSDFVISENEHHSRAMGRIKSYLQAFKESIVRKGNGLKTPKFHQMLHLVDYIIRHGCPMNYDGSRGENFGKTKIKDNAKLTNRQRDTLNFDIGLRLCEEDIVDQVSTIYYRNMGKWPSKYCNDTDIVNDCMAPVANADSSDSRYKMNVEFEYEADNPNINQDTFTVTLDWGGPTKTPMVSYPREMLVRLAIRLFVGTANIGGKVRPDQSIPGLTQVKRQGVIYRAHPCHSKKGSWYDWAYFDWGGFDSFIPARILMMLDLSNVAIEYEPDVHPDHNMENAPEIRHLSQEIWVIVLAAECPLASVNQISDDHFDSSINKRIKLNDDNDLWLVPLNALKGPCFVVENKDYTSGTYDKNAVTDNTAYVVDPKQKWPNAFLPHLNL